MKSGRQQIRRSISRLSMQRYFRTYCRFRKGERLIALGSHKGIPQFLRPRYPTACVYVGVRVCCAVVDSVLCSHSHSAFPVIVWCHWLKYKTKTSWVSWFSSMYVGLTTWRRMKNILVECQASLTWHNSSHLGQSQEDRWTSIEAAPVWRTRCPMGLPS